MNINIDELTEQELVELNQKIVARLKFLASARNHTEMLKFTIGEKVSFEAPGQGRQVGLLVKYNKKTVTVITESGQKWNVSPHLLSQIKNVSQTKRGKNKGKVIDLNIQGK